MANGASKGKLAWSVQGGLRLQKVYLRRAIRGPPPSQQGYPRDPALRFEVMAGTEYSCF